MEKNMEEEWKLGEYKGLRNLHEVTRISPCTRQFCTSAHIRASQCLWVWEDVAEGGLEALKMFRRSRAQNPNP